MARIKGRKNKKNWQRGVNVTPSPAAHKVLRQRSAKENLTIREIINNFCGVPQDA